jgi:hypothetical protein
MHLKILLTSRGLKLSNSKAAGDRVSALQFFFYVPPITYYWTGFLILDHSYLFGNLTNSKVGGTKVLEPLKS